MLYMTEKKPISRKIGIESKFIQGFCYMFSDLDKLADIYDHPNSPTYRYKVKFASRKKGIVGAFEIKHFKTFDDAKRWAVEWVSTYYWK